MADMNAAFGRRFISRVFWEKLNRFQLSQMFKIILLCFHESVEFGYIKKGN